MFQSATFIVLIIAGVVGLCVLMLLVQLNQAQEARRIKARMERSRGRKNTIASGAQDAMSLRINRGDSKFALLDQLVGALMPRPGLLRDKLAQTGYSLSIGQVAFFGAAAGGAVATALWIFVDPPGVMLLLAFVLISMILPHLVINTLIKRRVKAFLNEFPEALDLIIRGLKSGLPVTESIRNVGEEFEGPVGQEFSVVTDKVKLGQPLEEALMDSTNRVDIQDFKFFVISLAVQRETGGNLAETLENLVDILRRRRQMKLKIKSMSSEAKASAPDLGIAPLHHVRNSAPAELRIHERFVHG